MVHAVLWRSEDGIGTWIDFSKALPITSGKAGQLWQQRCRHFFLRGLLSWSGLGERSLDLGGRVYGYTLYCKTIVARSPVRSTIWSKSGQQRQTDCGWNFTRTPKRPKQSTLPIFRSSVWSAHFIAFWMRLVWQSSAPLGLAPSSQSDSLADNMHPPWRPRVL